MAKLKIITTSWDDGHKLDLRLAKLLKKYNIPATLYISPHNREWDRDELITDDETKLLSSDFEIGAHTMTHPELPSISHDEAYQEIKDSKNYLEQLLQKEIPMFCYPRGLYNKTIKQLVQKAGFIGARTIEPFHTTPPRDLFTFGTTNHTVNRSPVRNLKLSIRNNPHLIPLILTQGWVTRNWVEMSCRLLDYVDQHGGIWHFWGHSWQIQEHGWWESLEQVFEYAKQKTDFEYLTNGQVLAKTVLAKTFNHNNDADKKPV